MTVFTKMLFVALLAGQARDALCMDFFKKAGSGLRKLAGSFLNSDEKKERLPEDLKPFYPIKQDSIKQEEQWYKMKENTTDYPTFFEAINKQVPLEVSKIVFQPSTRLDQKENEEYKNKKLREIFETTPESIELLMKQLAAKKHVKKLLYLGDTVSSTLDELKNIMSRREEKFSLSSRPFRQICLYGSNKAENLWEYRFLEKRIRLIGHHNKQLFANLYFLTQIGRWPRDANTEEYAMNMLEDEEWRIHMRDSGAWKNEQARKFLDGSRLDGTHPENKTGKLNKQRLENRRIDCQIVCK